MTKTVTFKLTIGKILCLDFDFDSAEAAVKFAELHLATCNICRERPFLVEKETVVTKREVVFDSRKDNSHDYLLALE